MEGGKVCAERGEMLRIGKPGKTRISEDGVIDGGACKGHVLDCLDVAVLVRYSASDSNQSSFITFYRR